MVKYIQKDMFTPLVVFCGSFSHTPIRSNRSKSNPYWLQLKDALTSPLFIIVPHVDASRLNAKSTGQTGPRIRDSSLLVSFLSSKFRHCRVDPSIDAVFHSLWLPDIVKEWPHNWVNPLAQGKFYAGNPGFYHQPWGAPVDFPFQFWDGVSGSIFHLDLK